MLRHLQPSEFQSLLVIASFALTLLVFLFFLLRALRLNKDQTHHLKHLPLQDEPSPPPSHD